MRANKNLIVFAALNGAMSVAIGAFGAHGVASSQAELLQTGGQYQMVHAVLAAAIGFWPDSGRAGRIAGWLAASGGLVFCSALTLLALAGLRFMGAVAPIGGSLMILGWLLLAGHAVRRTVSSSRNL
ncbi:hypothetical protein OB03_08135 [Brevundimonas sp. GN22]|uniref:DUF423 domain-containing protein n=1 Tax=Brevundimonas pishanensis TaxID=2896315 RepID=UPI001FA8166D|nr:DUF423 domain-containing protein [Brevundimonas pishanensis]